MTNRESWRGEDITGKDPPEFRKHLQEKMNREFLPWALADPERARRILRRIMKDENGTEYLADFDGNYIGPLPDYLKPREGE